MTDPSSPSPDPRLGVDPFDGTPYRVIESIAAGGMGEIFLVEHRQLKRRFAAKVLHEKSSKEPGLVDRMRVEAQALARLRHGNIVTVTGFGSTADSRPFVVMEYLRGRTLEAELEAVGFVPLIESLRFTAQLLSALGAAHELGIVHRDIKPSNLFLCDPEDGARRLKVLDFGMVRLLPEASNAEVERAAVPTDSGILIGTPRYLSPEGALGQRVDPRADLYAAALMLYCMLAGRGPFDDLDRDTAMLEAHAHREPAPPSSLSFQAIPPELDAIILKALRKVPAERFQTAQEFLGELEHVGDALLCPPALQPTNIVGAIPDHVLRLAPSTQVVSSPSSSNDTRLEEAVPAPEFAAGAPRWLYVAVFLLSGALAAIVVTLLEKWS